MKALTRTYWTQEDLTFLKDNYLNMSYSEIGAVIKKTKSAVQNKMRVLGLKKPDKYTYNHSYFESIDNERKAYWLGFFFADGYVSKTEAGYCCGIELKLSDINHLRKFNKCINGNVEPIIRKRDSLVVHSEGTAIIRLFSKKIFEDLYKQGCVERKSDKIKMPNISEQYMWAFIRGFFDGDGCIVLDKNRQCPKFDFCSSSLEMLNQLREFLYKNNVCSYVVESKSDSTIKSKIPNYRLYISGMENGYLFATKMYKDSTIYLDRKYKKWQSIIEEYDIINRIQNHGKHGGQHHKILSA